MIYRALECTLYGSHHTPVTVWFQARSDAEASAKVRRLLAIAWDASESDVCVGNVDSELELERHSMLPLSARGARWFEVGGAGDTAYFDTQPQMVALDSTQRRRLDEARAEAVALARDMATKLEAMRGNETAATMPGVPDDVEHTIEDLAAFAAGR